MKTLRYSVVRFRPFVETGEFANAGIVALEEPLGLFAFKLTSRRVRRINQFFHDIDDRLFPTAIDMLKQELGWIRDAAVKTGGREAFEFLTKQRESAIVFSEPRARAFEGTLDDEVDALFDRYVNRKFATEEYPEAQLTREIKSRLRQSHVYGYQQYQIHDEIVSVTFDLASKINGLRVIRPLAFNHKSTVAIVDHGARWSQRFQLLLERGRLVRQNVLVPVSQEVDLAEPHAAEAKEIATGKLRDLGINVVDTEDFDAIVAFARPGSSTPVSSTLS
jgi:hypothetical protein